MSLKKKGLVFIVFLLLMLGAFLLNSANEKNKAEKEVLVFEKANLILSEEERGKNQKPSNEIPVFSMTSSELSEVCVISTTEEGYTAEVGGEIIKDESLAALIEKTEADGVKFVFLSVYAKESLSIKKRVTLSGDLKMRGAALNLSGSEVFLRDFYFEGENAYLRIKGGVTRGTSGNISVKDSSAVVLDFASGARFVSEGINVLSASVLPAVDCKMGSVDILGGKIVNSYGAAVISSATLTVSGAPEVKGLNFDVITDTPISLSGIEALPDKIRVMYKSSFDKGSFTPVFLDASPKSAASVSLFDESGAQIAVEYFDSSQYTEEKNILAVYLPNVLKLYEGEVLYASVEFLNGEKIKEPYEIKKEGYRFLGWYTNAELTEAYTFGNCESSDFSLFASFGLSPCEFSISSSEFSYDGKKRFLSFDYIYHPLMELGQFSFVWYKNSTQLDISSSSVPITEVKDSGSYYCKLTFSYQGDFVSVNTPEVVVTVHKMILKKPTLAPETYTGAPISPLAPQSAYFTVETAAFRDAGKYAVKLKITDTENTCWEESEGDTVFAEFLVLQAENEFLSPPTCEDIYEGELPRVNFRLKYGEGIAEYSTDGASWSVALPSSAGEYYLRVRAPESENYTAVISESIKFTVLKEISLGIKVDKMPDKTEYVAFEQIDLSGAEFTVSYNSGRNKKIGVEGLAVEYKNGSYLCVTDNAVTVVFEGCSVPLPISVKQAEYDISSIVFDDKEVVYSGQRHTIEASSGIVGEDGIPLGVKITGGGINAGVYSVTLEFTSESVNYKLPEKITRTLTVKPLSLPVVYANTEFVYDGKPHLPVAVIIGVEGAKITVSLSGSGVNAGNYVATAALSDANYTLTNTSVEFTILKADFDLSGVSWSASEFVYNGESHSVSVSGLPDAITIVGYANSSFTNAGSYMAEAAISYDEKNYNSPGRLTHEWKIKRADYDLSSLELSDAEYVFDGNYHYPFVSGRLPVGYDGISPTYSFSEGAKRVFEGKKAVTMTFSTESKNYNTPASVTLYVRILPKPIAVEWCGLSFVYDGTAHLPAALADECEIEVSGAGVDAGGYKAVATAKSSDYEVTNNEISFIVEKAENVWTSEPSVKDVYEGDAPSVYAAAIFGEVKYKFYKDAALSEPQELPLTVGEYYAVAVVEESKNYYKITSAPHRFSVLKILPVSLQIELLEPLFAMKKLTDFSLNACLINNNGSKTPVSKSDLALVYQNGDELRAADTSVYVAFGELYLELPVSVSKSVVEAPDITPVIYNGEIRLPSVLESHLFTTDFEGARNAGEYLITLSLTDNENYEFKNGVGTVSFVILKSPITLGVKKSGADYELLEGEIFQNDELSAVYYEKDGKIYLSIDNPNYELTVVPREEKNASFYVLLMFLIAAVVLLTSLALYIVFSRIEKRASASAFAPPCAREREKSKPAEAEAPDFIKTEPPLETLLAVDESYANNLISDQVAKSLISEEYEAVETDGKRRCILNIDTISENFSSGESVNINDFKRKGLIPADARYVKILARGVIDKPITILANSFSLAAVKMIALTGGNAKRVRTVRKRNV